MTEYRIVTNGETYRIEWRGKICWWWDKWKFLRCPANPWAPWDFRTFKEARKYKEDAEQRNEIAVKPWLPVDDHGQRIAPSNIAAQARQDGTIPPWPHSPEQQQEEIESSRKEKSNA